VRRPTEGASGAEIRTKPTIHVGDSRYRFGMRDRETPRRDRRPVRVPESLREERRKAILSLRSTGLAIHAIAERLGIGDNTVRNVLCHG
jgi:DNA-binding NarL/FixJ family response regulator